MTTEALVPAAAQPATATGGEERSVPTVKQHLAAIRMLGDWLVVSQVLLVNPAAAVRGPKHVVTKGATPVLSSAEARKLLEIDSTRAPRPGSGTRRCSRPQVTTTDASPA